MKKLLYAVLLFLTATTQPFHLSQKINSFAHNIASHFHKPKPSNNPETPNITHASTLEHLNPFQKFFRDTITFTQNTKNIFTDALEDLEQEAKQGFHSIETVGNAFIEKLEQKSEKFIDIALEQSFDINIGTVMPSIQTILNEIERVQKTITTLQNAPLLKELDASINDLQRAKQDAEDLQHAGVMAITTALAANTLLGQERELVDKIHNLYDLYPEVTNTIETMHIKDAGLKIQSLTNAASELCESVVLTHDHLGIIGTIIIEDELIAPIDILKNKIRKIGNSIEFTMSLEPIIIAAPPTTIQAMIQVVQACVFEDGIAIQALLRENIETTVAHADFLLEKQPIIINEIETLQRMSESLLDNIQEEFKVQIKANPLTTIPVAPHVLLEIVENHIGTIKTRLHRLISMSMECMERITHTLFLSAEMLEQTNQLMGATPEKPFINTRILKGIMYIGQDLNELRTVTHHANLALQQFTLL